MDTKFGLYNYILETVFLSKGLKAAGQDQEENSNTREHRVYHARWHHGWPKIKWQTGLHEWYVFRLSRTAFWLA